MTLSWRWSCVALHKLDFEPAHVIKKKKKKQEGVISFVFQFLLFPTTNPYLSSVVVQSTPGTEWIDMDYNQVNHPFEIVYVFSNVALVLYPQF